MFRKIFLVLSVSLFFTAAVCAQGTTTSTTAATASTSDKPAKTPVFRSNKDQVKEAQTMLKGKNLFSGEATGVSSAEWKASVKTYQGDNGLTKTGSLNRATLEKMGIALTDKQKEIPVNPAHIASAKSDTKTTTVSTKSTTTTTASTTSDAPKRPAPFRANAEQIKAAQKILRDGKMLTGGEDGKLDDATRAALKKYQEANGLKVSETGTLNAATLEKMGIALTDAQKANVAAQAAYDAAKPKN